MEVGFGQPPPLFFQNSHIFPFFFCQRPLARITEPSNYDYDIVHTSIVTKLPTWTSVIFCVHLSIQFMYISIMTKLPTCYFLSPFTHSISITCILKYLHKTILFCSIIYYYLFSKQQRPKADYVGGMSFYNLLLRIFKITEAEG